MALSRVKEWIAAEILFASDQNAEFDNIIDNALTLISPLTDDLNANNKVILNIGAAGTDFEDDRVPGPNSEAGVVRGVQPRCRVFWVLTIDDFDDCEVDIRVSLLVRDGQDFAVRSRLVVDTLDPRATRRRPVAKAPLIAFSTALAPRSRAVQC